MHVSLEYEEKQMLLSSMSQNQNQKEGNTSNLVCDSLLHLLIICDQVNLGRILAWSMQLHWNPPRQSEMKMSLIHIQYGALCRYNSELYFSK